MTMKTISKIVCGWCLLFCITSCSQIEYDIYGTLAGSVVDVDTNQPIEGASVILSPGGKNVLTAADGTFSFIDLDPQQYTVMVQKAGYSTNRKVVTVVVAETTQISLTMQKSE